MVVSRAATRNGQTGQFPPKKFLQTWCHSRTSHEKLFLETALPLRELLLKTTLSHTCCVILDKTINQSMHHVSENSQHRTGDKLWDASYEVKPVPSPRGFGELNPPKQSTKPPKIEIWNVINQCNFCQLWMSSPLCSNVKPPPHKCKAPLLTTFWRRSCVKTPVSWKWRCGCKCDLIEQESICYTNQGCSANKKSVGSWELSHKSSPFEKVLN